MNLARGGLTFEHLLRLRSCFHKPDRRRAHPRQLEQLEHRHLLSGGTWTELANPSPATATLLLLSSGEVMAEGGRGYASNKWDLLSPSSTGSYIHGSWSKLASMHTSRLFFASDVLPSGDVFVAGGEYSQGKLVESNRSEIYNPNTNTWKSTAPFPQPTLGDAPSEVLPNGSVLVGDPSSDRTYIYSPATKRWSHGGTKLDCDSSSEETWVKLPDGSILSYSINASVASGISQAQRYLPSIRRWVPTRPLPVPLSSVAVDYEIGPAFLLPDGRVFFLGGNSNTALYTPSTNRWLPGPVIPHDLASADAPGAMLPNGQVLFAAGGLNLTKPSRLFDFNPQTDRIAGVRTPESLARALKETDTSALRMLVLPTGQVLLDDGTHALWVYTPTGSPRRAWRPAVQSVVHNQGRIFTLAGTQITGISEGAAYGDDAQMATNYPIIVFKSSQNGEVTFARTFDWSSTGVATCKTLETTRFVVPSKLSPGTYDLSVIANGISSRSVSFRVA